MSPAWLYYYGMKLNIPRVELEHYPVGELGDYIAAEAIMNGAKQRVGDYDEEVIPDLL